MESVQDKSWHDYLAKIKTLSHRDIVERAVRLLPDNISCVVECGCGVGRNSQYLIEQGLNVHAFDKDVNAVNLCRMRFLGEANFAICISNLDSYIYPANGLVVASESLFFCEPECFALSWHNLACSIQIGGLFCGDFLGIKDTWDQHESATVMRLSDTDIKRLFTTFDILEWHEKDTSGSNMSGQERHRHTHTVLARKRH